MMGRDGGDRPSQNTPPPLKKKKKRNRRKIILWISGKNVTRVNIKFPRLELRLEQIRQKVWRSNIWFSKVDNMPKCSALLVGGIKPFPPSRIVHAPHSSWYIYTSSISAPLKTKSWPSRWDIILYSNCRVSLLMYSMWKLVKFHEDEQNSKWEVVYINIETPKEQDLARRRRLETWDGCNELYSFLPLRSALKLDSRHLHLPVRMDDGRSNRLIGTWKRHQGAFYDLVNGRT